MIAYVAEIPVTDNIISCDVNDNLQAVIDNIDDASTINPYTIQLSAGIYEQQLNMTAKTDIMIKGSGRSNTLLRYQPVTDGFVASIVELGLRCRLANLTVMVDVVSGVNDYEVLAVHTSEGDFDIYNCDLIGREDGLGFANQNSISDSVVNLKNCNIIGELIGVDGYAIGNNLLTVNAEYCKFYSRGMYAETTKTNIPFSGAVFGYGSGVKGTIANLNNCNCAARDLGHVSDRITSGLMLRLPSAVGDGGVSITNASRCVISASKGKYSDKIAYGVDVRNNAEANLTNCLIRGATYDLRNDNGVITVDNCDYITSTGDIT